MAELEKRNTQTIVKHIILEQYLIGWGSIICAGLRNAYFRLTSQGIPFNAKFAYIDPFAFQGRYADEDESGDPVYGSPIIGIRAMDKIRENTQKSYGFLPDVVAILIERKRNNFEILLKNLVDAGYSARIRETDDFSSLNNGEIAVINGDFRDYADQLLKFTSQKYLWAMYFLDPYGTAGIPMNLVQSITTQNQNDVIINFAYLALQRGLHPDYSDALYGSEIWREIAAIEDSEVREERFLNEYKRLLQRFDPRLAVKQVRILFPDKERPIFYLILTTHDPTGALLMNKILDNAQLKQYALRVQWQQERARQPSLFDFGDFDPSKPQIQRPSKESIANQIHRLCQGETLLLRDVLKRLLDQPYYYEDIKGALSLLKRNKRASYSSSTLSNDTEIKFSDR